MKNNITKKLQDCVTAIILVAIGMLIALIIAVPIAWLIKLLGNILGA